MENRRASAGKSMGKSDSRADNKVYKMNKAGDYFYRLGNMARTLHAVVIPYVKSRIYRGQFRPLFSSLFTEWRCNLSCDYCWDHDSRKEGMSFRTAKSSIDWLHSIGCRTLGLMGGEPLMRPDFTLKVISYASKKGMYVYLPTNGVLMTKEFIDKAGKAGVSAVNVAVDCVEPKPGLPKSLDKIRPQLEYLAKMRKKYGYIVFLNINITNRNMDDARRLTEIANSYGIGSDYHVCAPPVIGNSKNKNHNCGELCLTKDNLGEFDRLIDWLIEKDKAGYPIVNSAKHLRDMKDFVRGNVREWRCIAGEKGLFICDDGRIVPCFDMASSRHDWGRIWKPKFRKKQLDEMKEDCAKICMSTCYYTASFYHELGSYRVWLSKNWKL